MTLVGNAFALAAEVHKDQVCKAGEPYILHPMAVMQLATDYMHATHGGDFQIEKVQATALLHDAVEDTKGDRSYLQAKIYALDADVFVAVMALTKATEPWKEPYDEYLGRVEKNWIARVVKIADLSHNLDAFRIPSGPITEKDYERWDKYHRALVKLRREDDRNA
jgi:(p)ppGpp synthase/HD superfamily hydrolase